MTNLHLKEHCFIEYKRYNFDTYKYLYDALVEKGLCVKEGEKGKYYLFFPFTGFFIVNSEIFVVFPKTYPSFYGASEVEIKRHIRVLIGVLLRYKNEATLRDDEIELLGGMNNSVPEGIAAGFCIIKDYEVNGFISRKKSQYSTAGSNIDWPRTIKSKQPFFSKGKPIYSQVMVRQTRVDYENIAYRLHKYVVFKSFKKFGWLIGAELSEDGMDSELPCEKEVADYILQKELESTFQERETRLLLTMKEFIFGSSRDSEKTHIDTLLTPYFQNVWERICKNIFQDEYDRLKNLIPQPVWHIPAPRNAAKQKPDILYLEQNILFVLDAKYYDTKNTLPGWHDLVKQFFYAHSIIGVQKRVNVLLFPSTIASPVHYFGFIDFPNSPHLERIDAVSIDIASVMISYSERRYENFRCLLVQALQSEGVL